MPGTFGIATSRSSGLRQTGWRAGPGWLGDRVETWLEAERDHLPLWLPVALGAGISAWFLLPGESRWAAFILAMLGAVAAFAIVPGGRRLAQAGLWFALMAALGCGITWWRSEQVREPRLTRPAIAAFAATVEEIDPQPARAATRLWLAPDSAAGLPPRVRVNVEDDKMPAGLLAGARVQVRARLMPPAPAAVPGAYDFARVAWFQGLGATGRALDKVAVLDPGTGGGGFWSWLGGVRNRLSAHILASSPGARGRSRRPSSPATRAPSRPTMRRLCAAPA